MRTRKILARTLAAAVSLVALAAFAQADVGLVNQLNGDVSYSGADAKSAKAQAFMKVRDGDRFTVPAGAQLRVVYFESGREETWKGPATFRVGPKQSEAQSGHPAQISTLPSVVPKRIAQLPEFLQIAKLGRTGGTSVRGAESRATLTSEQSAEVASAKQLYKKMRAQAQTDDITPELYLYSVLQDYLLYADMGPVVDEMVKRQPQSREVRELAAWVKSRTQP
jgi:hypothetical protein